MNLHEYQSKELFAKYGIPAPTGKVAASPDEAIEAALGAHVCRCTGYARYHRAARELAMQVLRG